MKVCGWAARTCFPFLVRSHTQWWQRVNQSMGRRKEPSPARTVCASRALSWKVFLVFLVYFMLYECKNKNSAKWKRLDDGSSIFTFQAQVITVRGWLKIPLVKYNSFQEHTFKVCSSRSLWLNDQECIKINLSFCTTCTNASGIFCTIPIIYCECIFWKVSGSAVKRLDLLDSLGKLAERLTVYKKNNWLQ